jgi:hypothetical protein
MQPSIEIVRTQDGKFSFAVELGEGGEWYVRDGLISIAACVKKASAALGRQFKFAHIAYGVQEPEEETVVQQPPRALLMAANDLVAQRYW